MRVCVCITFEISTLHYKIQDGNFIEIKLIILSESTKMVAGRHLEFIRLKIKQISFIHYCEKHDR